MNALVLFAVLVAAIIYFVSVRAEKTHKRFLVLMITLIVFSRLIVSLAITSAKNGNLSQDEGLYSKKALIAAAKEFGIAESDIDEYYNWHFAGLYAGANTPVIIDDVFEVA
jgi:hypothetical protein